MKGHIVTGSILLILMFILISGIVIVGIIQDINGVSMKSGITRNFEGPGFVCWYTVEVVSIGVAEEGSSYAELKIYSSYPPVNKQLKIAEGQTITIDALEREITVESVDMSEETCRIKTKQVKE